MSALEDALELIRRGNVDGLVCHRRQLLDFVTETPRSEETALAAVLCCHANLVCLDKEGARSSLSPYLCTAESGSVGADEPALDDLAAKSPFVAGLVRCEIANFLFRLWRDKKGRPIAEKGLPLLDEPAPACLDEELKRLLAALAAAWCERTGMTKGGRDAALIKLAELRRQLIAKVASDKNAAGLALAAAIVSDLMADSLFTIGGRDVEALMLIHEAELLIRLTGATDRVRLGHIEYVHGKLLSRRVEEDACDRAVLLFEAALAAYPAGHPLRPRALNRKAICLMRAGRLDEAEGIIGDTLRIVEDPTFPADEGEYCRADLHLTRLHVLERRATDGNGDMTLCVTQADTLLACCPEGKVPPRHRAQALLHWGLNRLRSDMRKDDGVSMDILSKLKTALRIAKDEQRTTAIIACHLALAEYWADVEQQQGKALDHLQEAARWLRIGATSFLLSWADRLEWQLTKVATVRVKPGTKYKVAVKEMTCTLLRQHLMAAKDDVEVVARALGMSSTTIRRRANACGIELKQQKPGPKVRGTDGAPTARRN